MEPIYLDYNATTPLDPAVIAAMRPYLENRFGNPSSLHSYGIMARQAVELARRQVAGLLGAHPDEIVFTSGGTESNNWAIKGAAFANAGKGDHIVTTQIEHPAVTEVCRYLETRGFRVTWLPVDPFGLVDPSEVERALTGRTILVTVMHANNETGALQPVEEIGRLTRARGILFHTDAAQSVGKIPVNVEVIGADLLSVAGHKLYAPKGVGVLYIRRGVKLEKLIHGADHESNLRAGTENVIEIVGLGMAAEIASGALSQDDPAGELRNLRDRLFDGIRQAIPEVRMNGHAQRRLPNTLSLGFPGVEASLLLEEMKGVAASAGAACHSDRADVSGVLSAMAVPAEFAMGTLRFSLGRMTTREEIDRAIPLITGAFQRIRGDSRSWVTKEAGNGTNVKLTAYTHSLGCACKIRPQLLERILEGFPRIADPALLVGHDTADDAAVYRLDERTALVQTVDFIPPVVDDPYQYGAIAAANALSDIYAMGGKPLFALGIVGFPDRRLPLSVLEEILRGANDKAAEAGIFIAGGHSIEESEPKFGLTVTGIVDPVRILRNSTARAGDVLVLTKPIGTGIITTAVKRGIAGHEAMEGAIRVMSCLNRAASDIMAGFPVSACTDVSGFGLLGHLREMVVAAGVSVRLVASDVPVLPYTWELASAGAIPGGTRNNLEFVAGVVEWTSGVPELMKLILSDAQTSGGLLISLPETESDLFLQQLLGSGIDASVIGKVGQGPARIIV